MSLQTTYKIDITSASFFFIRDLGFFIFYTYSLFCWKKFYSCLIPLPSITCGFGLFNFYYPFNYSFMLPWWAVTDVSPWCCTKQPWASAMAMSQLCPSGCRAGRGGADKVSLSQVAQDATGNTRVRQSSVHTTGSMGWEGRAAAGGLHSDGGQLGGFSLLVSPLPAACIGSDVTEPGHALGLSPFSGGFSELCRVR